MLYRFHFGGFGEGIEEAVGRLWFFLIRHTHCCRHWRSALPFTGSKHCGHSVESGGEIAAKKERGVGRILLRGWRHKVPYSPPIKKLLVKWPDAQNTNKKNKNIRPRTRWPIFNSHAPKAQSSSSAQQTFLCVIIPFFFYF